NDFNEFKKISIDDTKAQANFLRKIQARDFKNYLNKPQYDLYESVLDDPVLAVSMTAQQIHSLREFAEKFHEETLLLSDDIPDDDNRLPRHLPGIKDDPRFKNIDEKMKRFG